MRDSNVASNAGSGIAVEASQIRVVNTTISNNALHGIALAFNSQADISGCDIYDNADYGVLLTAGSQANIDGNTIHHNVSGVHGHLSTTLVLHGNVIQENAASGVSGFFRSTIQISGAQINYNGNEGIALGKGSTLILLDEGTQAIGNAGPDLWCYDAQSYVDDVALLEMSQVTNCNQFGW
jgi:parallel beta-helix repeat protein